MDQILVAIQPFVLNQQIDIYKNGEHTYSNCKLEDLEDNCYKLCKENDIHKIILIGQKDFALKISEKINMLKYDNDNIDIKVVTQSL